MEKTQINQDEINRTAWKACDTFRGVVDPSEYKNYILVMLFLKYMSDVWKDHYQQYEQRYGGDEERIRRRLDRERFVMPEKSDFYYLHENRNEPNVGELIDVALAAIEEANKGKLERVFRNISFNSEPNLGPTKDRNRRLKHLLEDFANPLLDLRPSRIGEQDIIGDTYEFLISKFASDSGKKGGEFYTPEGVSILLSKLLAPKKGDRICDPTCGSGSLLIRVADEIGDRDFALYGQESNGSTWALAKMNMFLHGKDSAQIEWGDTLNNPLLLKNDELMRFDVVVANPPFSLDKWGADDAAADRYNRFHRGVPPRSKGDYAFISHMIETTVTNEGKVGVIAPHGVLFRGGSEGKIRQKLIEENLLQAVIGLPPNLFFGTGIPAAILLFERGRSTRDVLFIDASRDFDQGKNQNQLAPSNIQKVVTTYRAFQSVERYAHRATFAELFENDFNLNIPRYVDTFEEDDEVDISLVRKEIAILEEELQTVQTELNKFIDDLLR